MKHDGHSKCDGTLEAISPGIRHIVGLALFFYVTPAVIGAAAIDWEQEQAGEWGAVSGLATQEEKRISALPLEE
ncbi:MAG: hypothetical protein ACOX0T_10730 [Pelotomaculum sp.]